MDSEPAAPAPAGASPSVLVVDQDFLSRWQAADYLRERGYNVIEATGVADAITLIGSGLHVDTIFADLSTPDLSGSHELLEWLDKHHPRIPILLTSNTGVEARDRPSSSTRRFIDKPYQLSDIAIQLELLLGSMGVR